MTPALTIIDNKLMNIARETFQKEELKMPSEVPLGEWTNQTGQTIPSGKLECRITGSFKDNTEHEQNLQEIVKRLRRECDYNYSQMGREKRFQIGSQAFEPDVVVYEERKRKKKKNVLLVAEAEPSDTKPSDPRHGVGQPKSCMMSLPSCNFSLWFNGVEEYCYYQADPEETPTRINDIPPKGIDVEEAERPDFDRLIPPVNLRPEFRRCHNYIHANQGIAKDEAFQEFLKLIFCKVLDERESRYLKFYATHEERKNNPERCFERISRLFDIVKSTYSNIFDGDEEIELNPSIVAYIVGELTKYTLLYADTDVKGEAYEEIVGDNLRGNRGEFFTPREVCESAVEILFYTYPRSRWNEFQIIDPACGTGGFLISVINFLKSRFYEEEQKKWDERERALREAEDRTAEFCKRGLHGIDRNPLLARATQMNEVMHGNGHGNIFACDSLENPRNWEQSKSGKRVNLESFDMLFTNPPFGSDLSIEKPEILRQFDLAHTWEKENGAYHRTDNIKSSVPPGLLFVERSIDFLKPGGRMAIVLSDNILTNPGLEHVRYWLLQNARVIGRIDLPSETFEPFTGTNAHLVFLEKSESKEIETDYQSFATIAEKVGHDKRGKPIYLRNSEGDLLLQEIKKEVIEVSEGRKVRKQKKVTEKIKNNDLSAITYYFKDWWDNYGW